MKAATDHPYGDDLAFIQAHGYAGYARSASPWLIGQLRSLDRTPLRVIDIGCGAGVTTGAFLGEGFSVLAIEPSEPLARYARKAFPGADIHIGSVYDTGLPGCDAIVAIGEPLTYHPDPDAAEQRLLAFFAAAREALAQGGLLIFDFISSEGADLSSRSWSSGADWALLLETVEDQSRHMLIRDIVTFRRVGALFRRGKERHVVRLLRDSWVRDALVSAGFDVCILDESVSFAPLPRRRVVVASLKV